MPLKSSSSVQSFIGSEVECPYDSAQVVILPIPYEATTTYRKGCEKGPEAILTASDQLEYYDVELKWEVIHSVSVYTNSPIADTRSRSVAPEIMLQEAKTAVSRCIADGKFVIALGGEHAITTGIVSAYREAFDEPFTVVQIDAHGDLRYEYDGSIHNHACVMRRIWEMGLPILPVGIRSICQEEAALIHDKNIPVLWADEIANNPHWIEDAIAQIPTKNVFITIDLDGLDPTLMPGVGTPQPGGLDWYGLLRFLRRILETHRAIGCDVVELAPISDSVVSEFTAAKLVYKLIGYYALSQGWQIKTNSIKSNGL
ncbi:agmatinase [Lusitaniella coriacea]|uniref:agmatinase n=1 Tax=Lusitaniella coriacea TaxID=1983105 RepID=UPI003CF4CAA6